MIDIIISIILYTIFGLIGIFASKKISLIGIDSPSIDLGADSKFSVHQIFAKKGILIVENLANLEKIKSSKFHLVVLPLKLNGATGSPVRAIAFVE